MITRRPLSAHSAQSFRNAGMRPLSWRRGQVVHEGRRVLMRESACGPKRKSRMHQWMSGGNILRRAAAMGWPVDAGGLTEELIRLRDRYGNPELYVTENGACYDDELSASGVVLDDDRVAYLRDHLSVVRKSLAAGVKLRGYFVWSLLDKFEWAEGYSRRFGLVYVDFMTLKRTPKGSYRWLAEFIKNHTRRN
jgi:beta-glucosidase/6-phospho-beta-glucosidase/beta-galactosidase